MTRTAFNRRDWPTDGGDMLSAEPDRLRLFRDCRLASAGVALAAFPALALVEPWTAAAALMLCGVLPAAIALDCRKPDGLPRAVILAFAAAAAVLAAGVLKGVPPVLALALLAVQSMEALAVGVPPRRIGRIAALGAAGLAAAASFASGALEETAMVAALMLVANTAVLVFGLGRSLSRERRKAEAGRLQADEVEAIMADAVVAADRTGAVIRVSANTERVLGLSADALTGRGLVELVLVADRPQLLTALCDCAHGGPARRMRLRLRASLDSAAPRYRPVEFSIAPAPARTTAIVGTGMALATLRDVSDMAAAEHDARAVAAETQAAEHARAAFLATVNHELRTPLNAIIGFSEILANPASAPQNPVRLREYASLINGAGKDLLRIVTTMIDITRLDSGVYDFESEPADLFDSAAAAIEAFRQEPESAGADIRLLPPPQRVEIGIDQRAFRQVLFQILSNAAKFGGAAGAVTVTCGVEDGWATVSVSDHGPGVAPDKLAQLGRHFARLDERLDRALGGVGLGLSLASRLMALHGGRIGIASPPGGGAIATLSFPLAASTDAQGNVHLMPPRRTQPSSLAAAEQDVLKRRA